MATTLTLCACAVLSWINRPHKHFSTDPWMKKDPSYKYNKTIAYWTDKPPAERGPVPYTPPVGNMYNTTAGPVAGKINVHLVPHSHDDTGWLVSVDQYFYEEVKYILDTLLTRLSENPDRRFMFVETGFFIRWWRQQNDANKLKMKKLVQGGQLEFINGGWCMHDEAAPTYVEMIDQTTRGHQFLYHTFGIHPKGSWTIDPFGHSHTNAWLIGAESGMNYLFWGRMDYQDFKVRKDPQRQGLEWVWEGSQSLGSSAQIFAGQLFGTGSQGYSTWFTFEEHQDSHIVRDDPILHDYNVDALVDEIVSYAKSQDASTQGSHQMWACGGDFNFQNSQRWYDNMDKLIHYLNLNGTINLFYSTPTLYVQEKNKEKANWEVRKDDIFPLADDAHHYWTGYFTSRPALKRQVRFASNFLNAARQMEVISRVNASAVNRPTTRPSPPVGSSWTDSLEGSIGVATHHDGMSGTERQAVADDYAQRISDSHGEVEVGVAKSLSRLMGKNISFGHCGCSSVGGDNCLNISMCPITTNEPNAFTIAAWNPLAHDSRQHFRIPVTAQQGEVWDVFDHRSSLVTSDLIDIDARTRELPLLYLNKFQLTPSQIQQKEQEMANKATHVIAFTGDLPPLGYTVFTMKKRREFKSSHKKLTKPVQNTLTISNEHYSLEFNTETGTTSKLLNLRSGLSTPLTVTAGWYNNSGGGCKTDPGLGYQCSDQKGGAYIFRPNSSTFFPCEDVTPQLEVLDSGEQVSEVYQRFSSWMTVVYRLWKGSKNLEIEWTAGPMPIYKNGMELVLRYSTGLDTDGVFYTDSNAREMVKRVYNQRGPSYPPLSVNEIIAGNYYPVNAMISIQDTSAQFTVVTDATQGGASVNNGEVELMLHRRLQIDDARGVQEPLNETMCGCNDIHAGENQMGAHGHEGDGGCVCSGLTVRGKHIAIFDTIEEANTQRRQEIETIQFPATLAFATGNLSIPTPQRTYLSRPFPQPLKLMTLTSNYAHLNGNYVLLRIAHLYSVGEVEQYSKPITIDLADYFSERRLTIDTISETQLTGTISLKQMESEKLRWNTKNLTEAEEKYYGNHRAFTNRYKLQGTTVTLRPMEVKTFLARFN